MSKTKLILISIFGFGLLGFIPMRENNRVRLFPDKSYNLSDSSWIEISYLRDSVEIKYNLNFSDGRSWKLQQLFIEKNGNLFERKVFYDSEGNTIDTLLLLSFTKRDTSFVYKYDKIKHPPTLANADGFDDWKYHIHKDKTGYKMEKTMAEDSLNKEIITYTKDFEIVEIHLYWHDERMVFRQRKSK